MMNKEEVTGTLKIAFTYKIGTDESNTTRLFDQFEKAVAAVVREKRETGIHRNIEVVWHQMD